MFSGGFGLVNQVSSRKTSLQSISRTHLEALFVKGDIGTRVTFRLRIAILDYPVFLNLISVQYSWIFQASVVRISVFVPNGCFSPPFKFPQLTIIKVFFYSNSYFFIIFFNFLIKKFLNKVIWNNLRKKVMLNNFFF